MPALGVAGGEAKRADPSQSMVQPLQSLEVVDVRDACPQVVHRGGRLDALQLPQFAQPSRDVLQTPGVQLQGHPPCEHTWDRVFVRDWKGWVARGRFGMG
jgi:hypothetical protein